MGSVTRALQHLYEPMFEQYVRPQFFRVRVISVVGSLLRVAAKPVAEAAAAAAKQESRTTKRGRRTIVGTYSLKEGIVFHEIPVFDRV